MTPQQQSLAPNQQKAMSIMLKQAMSFLTEEGTAEHILMKAEQGDPKGAVVDAVVPLLKQIYGASQAAGAQVEFPTLLATGLAIVLKLAELLADAGIIQKDQIPAFAAEASKVAIEQHNASIQGGGKPAPTGMMSMAPGAPQGA